MVDLLYPYAPARVLGKKAGASEMLPIVEPNGLVVAQASREYCHTHPSKLLHPVVHLHIIDRRGRLFLQKRGAEKDIYPGRWDTAVGGHVSYGERIVEALRREASEELGLREFNEQFISAYIFESESGKELVHTFAVVGDYDIHPDNDEVQDGRYWTESEIEENFGKSVFTPNFESEYGGLKQKLLALL